MTWKLFMVSMAEIHGGRHRYDEEVDKIILNNLYSWHKNTCTGNYLLEVSKSPRIEDFLNKWFFFFVSKRSGDRIS